MKTRSNRTKENVQEAVVKANVPDRVTFLLSITALLAVALVSMFVGIPGIFFLTCIVSALSVVALVTANKFLVTISAASVTVFVAASFYDQWHVLVLVLVVTVTALYWKHISPVGLILCSSFFVAYSIVIYQTFGASDYFWCCIVLAPVHVVYAFVLAAVVKQKAKMASWI